MLESKTYEHKFDIIAMKVKKLRSFLISDLSMQRLVTISRRRDSEDGIDLGIYLYGVGINLFATQPIKQRSNKQYLKFSYIL